MPSARNSRRGCWLRSEMIPAWKVRLAAVYVAVFFIIGLAFCFIAGRYCNDGVMQREYDRGVVYGASLPCGAQ